jgi:tetratricopeptide (TPR) repeat protein
MLGMILAQRGDLAQAEDVLRRAAAQQPKVASAHTNLGNILQLKGDPVGAEASFRAALALDPTHAVAHFNLALSLKSLGKLREAVTHLEQAIRLKPDYAEAFAQLGSTQQAMGKYQEALASLEQSVNLKPDGYEALYNRGLALMALERFEEAVIWIARAAALRQNSSEAFLALAQALGASSQTEKALPAAARAVALDGKSVQARIVLGSALLQTGRPQAGLKEVREALTLDPTNSEAHVLLGRCQAEMNQLEEAVVSHERAVELKPNSASALDYLASTYLSLGRNQEALATYERALESNPYDTKALISASRATKFQPGDWRLEKLVGLLNNADSMRRRDQIRLNFALGRAYEDLADYDRAFSFFAKGNALQANQGVPEDIEKAQFAAVKALFTREFVNSLQRRGSDTELPTFVLGMPRSGSTLTEQILASHPEITAAGEVLEIDLTIQATARRYGLSSLYPQVIGQLPPQAMREMGDEYATRLARRAPGGKRTTDKLPGNFAFIGFIHLSMPKAKIIHTLRNPMDVCVSIFTNLFNEKVVYASDLALLGRYYRNYHDLMQHWREVLPEGSFLDVAYEELVGDIENKARRIIDYVGLPWDDRCLAFPEAERAVHTLSISQVRQPVYQTSVERWRRYEKHLGPLIEALGDLAPVS